MVELTFDKLYLAKEGKDSKQDIYVVKCPLVQHQLDGIRFLYRALQKKKFGVVLNDPSGYGKRVQTALFLSAILPTLDMPVLILCREGKEQQWMSHFRVWTLVSDDVTIELLNPFAKKRVLISACYAAAAFARRDWSVLVVDDDLISKDIKSTLKAHFKIWITSSAIKDNLKKYAAFYSWMYPKNKFDDNKYKANKNDLNDVLTKTAMLDAFLEDTVLRREYGVTPFSKTQDSISINTEANITKKNKDATGMKIKRSKGKSLDNNTGITEVTPNKVAKNITTENTEVFEIGDIDQNLKVSMSTRNTQSDAKRDYEINDANHEIFVSRKRRDKSKKSILWDSESSEDEVRVNKNHDHKNNLQLDESEEPITVLRWDSDTDTENGHKKTTLDSSKETMSCKPKQRITEESTNNNEVESTESDNKKNDLENNGLIVEEKQSEIHENDINNEVIDKEYIYKSSEDLFSTDFTTNSNEINVKVSETLNTDIPTNPNNLKVKESENESTKVCEQNKLNEKIGQKMEQNDNLSILELKMKQLEELTLKKYKGSFLDSIL